MNYPIVIHKDKGSDYGVTVPDLPGCFSAGATLDEALAMAREAIELHLEGLIEEGQPIPEPGSIEQHRRDPRYKGGVWAVVAIASSDIREKARRINITMPQRVLEAVDRFARANRQPRSGLLVRAASAFIGRAAGHPRLRPGGRVAAGNRTARRER